MLGDISTNARIPESITNCKKKCYMVVGFLNIFLFWKKQEKEEEEEDT